MKVDYHKPTDDVEKINFEKILKTVKLSSNIVLHAANLDHKVVIDRKLKKSSRDKDVIKSFQEETSIKVCLNFYRVRDKSPLYF